MTTVVRSFVGRVGIVNHERKAPIVEIGGVAWCTRRIPGRAPCPAIYYDDTIGVVGDVLPSGHRLERLPSGIVAHGPMDEVVVVP